MIRCIDFLLATFGIVVTFPILLLLFLIGIFDTGSPLFVQVRVGKHQQHFNLIKFRTMKLNTASVATHLVQASAVTSFGRFLRRTKLDELPQLWNVVKGEMSLVGPRPCLPNQKELIDERQKRGVFQVLPGITGLAQIKGIDMSTPQLLAQTDAQMIQDLTLRIYFQYLFMTIGGAGRGDRIK